MLLDQKHFYLRSIIEKKQQEVEDLYKIGGIEYFQNKIQENNKHTSFLKAITNNRLNLIAEIKKASPSKGIIRKDFYPIALAKAFQKFGASALSVLTEKHYFLGDPNYIPEIKNNVNLPILRKDFIFDPIQIYESKAIQADAVLLIKSILTIEETQNLLSLAKKLGLDVLLEIHNMHDLNEIRILRGVKCIGINNRDLNTFKVDISISEKLLPKVKEYFAHALVVAESGYSELKEIKELATLGFNAVLIGEGLAKNPGLWDSNVL
jgi:indole-3-glycerol phosphate synthase